MSDRARGDLGDPEWLGVLGSFLVGLAEFKVGNIIGAACVNDGVPLVTLTLVASHREPTRRNLPA
jgi:hypothetical protein